MEHIFIINPVAGKGKPMKYIPQIKKIFADRDEKYRIEITEKPGHATAIAKEYAAKCIARIYSVGGDGTLNEVLNGMAGTQSSLAVIPGGSGNDFIKTLCKDYTADDILGRTVDGRERPIDLARVNGRYFLNISSVGFDAEVASNTNRHKKIYGFGGSLAYISGVAETLFKYANNRIRLWIDGKHFIEKVSLLLAVANGRYYGGGMMPAPMAAVDDGILDVCLIEGKSIPEIIRFFPKFMKGRHADIEGVHFYRGQAIEVECERETRLNIDGESMAVQKASFAVIPAGIRVVAPAISP